MSHPAITTTKDERQRGSKGVRYSKTDSTPFKVVAVYENGNDVNSGSYEKKSLTASTNNPVNAYGWRSPAPYGGSKAKNEYNSVSAWAIYKAGPYTYKDEVERCAQSGLLTGPSFPASDSYIADAEIKCLGKFKNVAVDLSVAFAERRQTASLASDTARSLLRLWKAIKRGNPGASIDELGNLWLSYRYGWSPTISDLYGALEALERRDNGRYDRYIVSQKASSNASVTNTVITNSSLYGGSLAIVGKRTAVSNGRLAVKVRMDAALTKSSYLRLQEVGVTDPASTMWELFPYSFVIDWFYGVGDWLNSVNALDSYQFLGESCTVYKEWDQSIYFKPTGSNSGGGGMLQKGTGSSFGRLVKHKAPSPVPQLQRNPLNLTRLADSLALLKNAFRAG